MSPYYVLGLHAREGVGLWPTLNFQPVCVCVLCTSQPSPTWTTPASQREEGLSAFVVVFVAFLLHFWGVERHELSVKLASPAIVVFQMSACYRREKYTRSGRLIASYLRWRSSEKGVSGVMSRVLWCILPQPPQQIMPTEPAWTPQWKMDRVRAPVSQIYCHLLPSTAVPGTDTRRSAMDSKAEFISLAGLRPDGRRGREIRRVRCRFGVFKVPTTSTNMVLSIPVLRTVY